MTDLDARISGAFSRIETELAEAASENGRESNNVALMAVSKTRTTEEMAAAYRAGARQFGENYLQEALPKIQWFREQNLRHLDSESESFTDICWHFIGALQSNKTREVAENFSWVHTVDREKIARRLAAMRPDDLPPLNICVQVNLHDEEQKAGLGKDELADLLGLIKTLPRLVLRGLMILPATNVEPIHAFTELAELFDQFAPEENWDTLSMGMSGDYRVAIAAGSTMVRIGTALFGPRQP